MEHEQNTAQIGELNQSSEHNYFVQANSNGIVQVLLDWFQIFFFILIDYEKEKEKPLDTCIENTFSLVMKLCSSHSSLQSY
ncbi:hypothetical protein BLOT_015202 [Blomia tropicalis]|nr:hypothetical protein BLOT_015202 [Blomia tropicalis]